MPRLVADRFRYTDHAGIEHESWSVAVPIKAVDVGETAAATFELHVTRHDNSYAPACIANTTFDQVRNRRFNRRHIDLEGSKILGDPFPGVVNIRQLRWTKTVRGSVNAIRR